MPTSTMRIALTAVLLAACGSTPPTSKGPTGVESRPASSSCAHFDPSGTWTVESDVHDPLTLSLSRDDRVALEGDSLGWDWEASRPAASGCVVRFRAEAQGASCEYAVVAHQPSVSGHVWCCERNDGERAICDESPVTGTVSLAK